MWSLGHKKENGTGSTLQKKNDVRGHSKDYWNNMRREFQFSWEKKYREQMKKISLSMVS